MRACSSVGVERLDQEIVAPRLDALQAIVAIAVRGHDHDRNEARYAVVLQAAADLEALPGRRDEVDQHEVGRTSPAGGERIAARVHYRYVMALFGQQPLEETGAGLVVVRDEDGRAQAHRARARARQRPRLTAPAVAGPAAICRRLAVRTRGAPPGGRAGRACRFIVLVRLRRRLLVDERSRRSASASGRPASLLPASPRGAPRPPSCRAGSPRLRSVP